MVSKIAILIERYKKGASVDECKNFFHPAQRELNELLAAQQSVEPTLLNGKYVFENRLACVCTECQRYADIPGTIVHSSNCSQAFLGATLGVRAAEHHAHWTLRLWAGLKNIVGLGSRQ